MVSDFREEYVGQATKGAQKVVIVIHSDSFYEVASQWYEADVKPLLDD
jgi:hypothetical protein